MLDGIKIISAEGNRLDIEKKGRKDRVYVGMSHYVLYLWRFQTGINMLGVLKYDRNKTDENPFSGLVGQTVEIADKRYIDSAGRGKRSSRAIDD